jgi:hypothetical protein
LTYKISQASWNPENLSQSTVQILRNPGWLLKWIGSLLVVIGVFMMFYLQPYRKQTEGEAITPTSSKPNEQKRECALHCHSERREEPHNRSGSHTEEHV